jgi:hypothetical protein
VNLRVSRALLIALFALPAFVAESSVTFAASMFSTLYSFAGGSDGASPAYSLIFDASGALYGATEQGGDTSCSFSGPGCGTVFDTWRCLDRERVFDASGALYGTTEQGGGTGCNSCTAQSRSRITAVAVAAGEAVQHALGPGAARGRGRGQLEHSATAVRATNAALAVGVGAAVAPYSS